MKCDDQEKDEHTRFFHTFKDKSYPSVSNLVNQPLLQNCNGWSLEGPSSYMDSNWRISNTNFYKKTITSQNTKKCTTYLGVHQSKGRAAFTLAPDENGNCRGILHTRNGKIPCWGDRGNLGSKSEKSKIKHLVQLADPEFKDVDFKLPKNQSDLQRELISEEENSNTNKYKVGIVVCKDGQVVDDDIFSNEYGSNEYKEFLNLMGDTIELKGFQHYSGGLDVQYNLTGTKSVYTKYYNNEIMFHVSTMLPLTSGQQLERKRHIGNDICVVVFHEGNHSYNPSTIVSHFIHIVIVVQLDKATNTYRVSVARKEGIETNILPPIPQQIEKSKIRDFLLTKLINANNASLGQSIFAKESIIKRENFLNGLYERFR